MCKKEDMETIVSYLSEQTGEDRSLGEWQEDINGLVPSNRRRTTRELGHMFCVIRKKGLFVVERTTWPVRYCFSQQINIEA
jgi:hypothetical protein